MGVVIVMPNGARLILLGAGVLVSLFLIYGRYQDSEIFTPDAIDGIQRIAYGFYITLVFSFGAIGFGLYKLQKSMAASTGLIGIIASSTDSAKSRRIFLVTFVTYGVVFSLISGTLVYQPEVNFAIHYGAEIPSGFIAPCCDNPGYMPKIIIYLTEHVGLQIIPINLVLQVIVSYLVGLNVSAAASVMSRKGCGLGGIGGIVGLFIACPTCAGAFLSIFVGTASGIALSIALVKLQTLFIIVSIPILLITPLLLARKLRNAKLC